MKEMNNYVAEIQKTKLYRWKQTISYTDGRGETTYTGVKKIKATKIHEVSIYFMARSEVVTISIFEKTNINDVLAKNYRIKYATERGCYLTSACTQAMGLPDTCEELTKLGLYRDTYLQTHYPAELQYYYNHASKIVEAMTESMCMLLYHEMIVPCITLIDAGAFEEAYTLYKEYSEQVILELGVDVQVID